LDTHGWPERIEDSLAIPVEVGILGLDNASNIQRAGFFVWQIFDNFVDKPLRFDTAVMGSRLDDGASAIAKFGV